MSDNSRGRERDLILAPNEYAYILDETKGNIVNYVGPHKTSLANTDQPVVFNSQTKRFEGCKLEQATQVTSIAPEGWYIVLKNPPTDGRPPKTGTANNLPDLNIGRKVNLPGPISFALWPGQMVKVIQGHHLRSNQYLVVRVYDEEAAKANWGKAVIKPQTPGGGESLPEEREIKPDAETLDLTMGKLLVIKGTDVAFYIPPTGIAVVQDGNGQYVREAVTLERLEYCILLDEDGNKRYIEGPDVVFPRPTETFVTKNGSRKFRAIELNEISGLYIKVIAPYVEGGQEYKVGDELFITGKDQMIYFPRPEHAIIRYADREVHYAVAIPAGEARYLLNRHTGQISLQKGPTMLLPDPRKEVIVRRVLDPRTVELCFPGNLEALEYNRRLLALSQQSKGQEYLKDMEAKQYLAQSTAEMAAVPAGPTPEGFVGDEFTRKQSFSQPRTITLDTKYEGAVAINVWTGYAVMVVSKRGERKVIRGPQTHLLEYDETLETIEFSTGTPKTDAHLAKSVYLRVLHNKVSDLVEAETRDLCKVHVLLSYRVNFEGDPEKWFNVENYVKFLTDHMRSMLRHVVRQHGVEEFYADAISIVRDSILGATSDIGRRPGRGFEENGMRIYDVEVLDVQIGDETIADLLVDAQHNVVEQTLALAAERRRLDITRQREDVKQGIAQTEAATQQILLSLQEEETKKRMDLTLTQINSELVSQQKRLSGQMAEQEALGQINREELARQGARHDMEINVNQRHLEQHIQRLGAEVQAVVNKAQAVSPHLVSALQSFSDRALAESMAKSMSPLAILGGKSVADVLSQLLKGTALERALAQDGGGDEVE